MIRYTKTQERVAASAERFFQRSGRTQWATVRQIARSLRLRIGDVYQAAEDHENLDLAYYLVEWVPAKGDYYVEVIEPPAAKWCPTPAQYKTVNQIADALGLQAWATEYENRFAIGAWRGSLRTGKGRSALVINVSSEGLPAPPAASGGAMLAQRRCLEERQAELGK